MSTKKIIVVTGATGKQGSSVIRFLLLHNSSSSSSTFAIRAITRNPHTLAAKQLTEKGVEVVKADLGDFESLKQAFDGAYGVYGVTNFMEAGRDGEIQQGKLLVDAAKATGVQHFIWSTLDRSPFKVVHWESKADVDDYLKRSGVPRTSLYTTFYFENFTGEMKPRKTDDGSYELPMPYITDAPFAVFPACHTGAFALAAFLDPDRWINNDMRVASEFLSTRDMARIISDVSVAGPAGKKKVRAQEVSEEMFETFRGGVVPEGRYNGMRLLFANCQSAFRDPTLSRTLYPDLMTFRQWVEKNLESIIPQ